jgi:hypothetical protein
MPGVIDRFTAGGGASLSGPTVLSGSGTPRVDKGGSAGQNEKASQYETPECPELTSSHSCPSGGTGRRAAFRSQ